MSSLYGAELQIGFILHAGEACRFALPTDWATARMIRQRLASVAAPMSPSAARDNEILEMLMS